MSIFFSFGEKCNYRMLKRQNASLHLKWEEQKDILSFKAFVPSILKMSLRYHDNRMLIYGQTSFIAKDNEFWS